MKEKGNMNNRGHLDNVIGWWAVIVCLVFVVGVLKYMGELGI